MIPQEIIIHLQFFAGQGLKSDIIRMREYLQTIEGLLLWRKQTNHRCLEIREIHFGTESLSAQLKSSIFLSAPIY